MANPRGNPRFRPGGDLYRPPSGIPASGIPASGMGWGGPSRRQQGIPDWKPITAETQPPPSHKSAGHMEKKAYQELLREKLSRAAEAYDAAFDSPHEAIRLKAAEMLEKRVLGDYKQTVEVQADTRTDEEIKADIARKLKELGDG